MEDKKNSIKNIKRFVNILGCILLMLASFSYGDSISIWEAVEVYFFLWLCSCSILMSSFVIVFLNGCNLLAKFTEVKAGGAEEMISMAYESYPAVIVIIQLFCVIYIMINLGKRKKDREIVVDREFISNNSSTTYTDSNVGLQESNTQSGMVIDEKHSDGSNI